MAENDGVGRIFRTAQDAHPNKRTVAPRTEQDESAPKKEAETREEPHDTVELHVEDGEPADAVEEPLLPNVEHEEEEGFDISA